MLKVVIVDGVLDSKRRYQKEQEGDRYYWLDKGTAINGRRSVLPPASSRHHLGQINGAGLTDITAETLRGGGGDLIKTYKAKDLD